MLPIVSRRCSCTQAVDPAGALLLPLVDGEAVLECCAGEVARGIQNVEADELTADYRVMIAVANVCHMLSHCRVGTFEISHQHI